jgi:hypothetical protein
MRGAWKRFDARGRTAVQDAYDTPFDWYDTLVEKDVAAPYLEARLDRLEARMDRLKAVIDRLEATIDCLDATVGGSRPRWIDLRARCAGG